MDALESSQDTCEPYFTDAEQALDQIQRAIRAERSAGVAAGAERLLSASLASGASLVVPIAAELAQRADADDLNVAAHLLGALERAVVQTRAALPAGADTVVPAARPRTAAAGCLAERVRGPERAPSQPPTREPPTGAGGLGGYSGRPLPRRQAAARWSAWIPLACVLAICVLIARVLSPSNLSGLVTDAAAAVLLLAAVRLAFSLVADRRTVAAMRSTLCEIAASELQMELLFEHNPQPMWVYDRATLEILAVSNAAIASYGYSREQFLAMSATDLRAPEDVPTLLDFLQTADGRQRLGFSAADPWRQMRKDGSVIEVEITSDDLIFQGRECRIVLSEDVTDRNRAEAELASARDEAVEASNLKSAFLATMSHEMRTPMQGVIGMNEMLLATNLSREQRGYAEQVARSGAQMLAIVEDVLDISSLEAGAHELTIAPFDLRDTLARACTPAHGEALAKGLEFELAIGAEVPRIVVGDSETLRRAVAKLVSNAVKFSEAGLVAVRVGASGSLLGQEGRIRIAVSDAGIGIDAPTLDRVFEPFVQADRSTTRRYGGIGLGLAIARELVELMGGVICAESEPGRGSTFWFELDLSAADPDAPGPPARRRPCARRAGHPPLVLVADDSHINQIAAVCALRRCGCRADVVGDGAEALQALALKHYDAVLMDCSMPGVDGYQATALLRQREHGAHTPVIAMTTRSAGGDDARCAGAGMDGSIAKPMRPETLRETLERWIPAFAEGAELAQVRASSYSR